MWSDKLLLILGCVLHSHSVLSLWSCTQDTDCSTTEGSFCRAGDCVCPAGKQLVLGGSRCVDSAPYLSSSCLEDHQCMNLVTNFECRRIGANATEGNCFCQPGFHYFHGRCWRSVGHGGSCHRDEECLGVLRDPYSLTCQEGSCGCAEGYYERQRGECRQIALAVGDGCVLDEDCQFENGVCDAVTFTCANNATEEVPESFKTTVSQQMNVTSQSRQQGTACGAETACTPPFVCSTFGSCVCPNGYYASTNGQLCLAELGSPSTEAQCTGFLAVVIDGVCRCPPNIYYEENMRDCVKATRRLSDACVSDQMCHTFGASARCSEPQQWGLRSCQCEPQLSVWDQARDMCRLFVGIGENCEVDSDCLAGGMEIKCVADSAGQGVCACPEGYAAVNGLCLTSGLELGDSCQATQECTGTDHSVCAAGVCACGEDYLELDGVCAPTIGGTCNADDDCTIENTECVAKGNATESTCQCADSFVDYNDACWPALDNVNSECEVTAQCTAMLGEASACVAGRCQCLDDFHLRDGGCWPRIELFGPCTRKSECFLQDISERVVCRNSMCQCSFDYPYSELLHTCTSSASAAASSIFTTVLALFYLCYSN